MQSTNDSVDLITDEEFGTNYCGGNSKITRQAWRRFGRGPKFVKIGRRVFFRRSEIEAWLINQECRTNAEQRMRARDTAAA